MHVVSQAAELSPGFEAEYWEFPDQRLVVARTHGFVGTENLFVAIRKLPDWFRRQPRRVVDWREVEFHVLDPALLDRAVGVYSPERARQRKEDSPERARQRVEDSPERARQRVEDSPERARQRIEDSPERARQRVAEEIAVFVMRPGLQSGIVRMFEAYSVSMARKLVVVKSIADAGRALELDFSWYPGERAAARGGSVG